MTIIDEINEKINNKQFEDAKFLIENYLKEKTSDIEILKLAGLTYVNLELWDDGKNSFETVVKHNQEDATSWFYLAKCYEKLDDLISSKNAYIEVIKLRQEYVDAYKNLCLILIKMDDRADTLYYARKAKEISEDYLFDFIIGTAFMKNKDFESAIQPLLCALEKAPNNLGSLNALGTCYMATNNFEKAIQTYEIALQKYPEFSMSYFNLGSAYQIMQNHEKAIEYLKKAVDIEENEISLTTLAISEIKLERFEDALKHYKQLALLHPDKEIYKYNIANCYEALCQFDIAIKILEEITYINPKFTLPAQKLASLYLKTNQLVKAKNIYDNILLKNNVTADTMHQYAILSSSLCDSDTAEKMLKKVIRMNPNIAKAHKDLGIIYLNKRLFDYAEDEFKIALSIDSNDFEILFEYGNFLYSISKNTEAEHYYKEALKLNPNNVITLTFLGLNSLILNKLDEAKEYILKALEKEPNHEYVQFCVGRILYARGEYEEAKRFLIRSFEQNQDIETQNTLALTYFQLKEYQQALEIFKNINTKRPKNVSILMDIAKCYESLNDFDNALSYLNEVVEIFPDNEDAHEMIRKLS